MQGKNSTHIVVTGCDAAIEEGILARVGSVFDEPQEYQLH
jgi:hypothetical protein